MALALLGAVSTGAQAAVVTLDFNEQPVGNCYFLGGSVTSQGVTMTKTGNTSGFFACNNPGLIANNPTDKAMIDANARSQFDMALQNGDAFDLQSFEAGTRTNSGATSMATGIRLTGLLAGGGSVTTDLMFSGTAWSTFSLSGFDDVVKVSWLALGDSDFSQFLFDNVVLDNAPTADVPEPGSLALVLAAGLAAAGVGRRQRLSPRA